MSKMIGMISKRHNLAEFKKLNKVRQKTQQSIRQAWFGLGKDLEIEAKKEIKRTPKSGRTYFIRTRSGRVRRHVASAPGETHANLTGKLRRSVSWKVHGYSRMEFGYGVATVAANAAPEYDSWVEDGHDTRGGSRVAARPSMENAVRKIKRTTSQHFEKAMLKGFKRS